MDLSGVITRGFTLNDRLLWQVVFARADCSDSGLSPDDWYPVSLPADAARQEAAAALSVCARCPVREECLELALRSWKVGQFGVWGGTVPAERRELRTARAAQLARALARNRVTDQAASSA
jgi:WhiB family transcriptional regulator, redox-sensing transcriptional regulator